MIELAPNVKDDALKRLRRIEGQVRGVQRMIEENRDCHEILHQLTAIRAAAYQTSLLVARNFAAECLRNPDGTRSAEAMVDELLQVLGKMPD